MFILLFSVVVSGFSVRAHSTPYTKVGEALRSYDVNAGAYNDSFEKRLASQHDIEWVKLKIAHMYGLKTYTDWFANTPARNGYTNKEELAFSVEFNDRQESVNSENLRNILNLLETYDWFWISRFGALADQQAFLMVEGFNSDTEFQMLVLKRLSKNVLSGETRSRNYAILLDRVAVNQSTSDDRRLQRYGSQGNCVAQGRWLPWPVEDESCLDQRRAKFGMEAEVDLIRSMSESCL